jgi:hypothetical protein
MLNCGTQHAAEGIAATPLCIAREYSEKPGLAQAGLP